MQRRLSLYSADSMRSPLSEIIMIVPKIEECSPHVVELMQIKNQLTYPIVRIPTVDTAHFVGTQVQVTGISMLS